MQLLGRLAVIYAIFIAVFRLFFTVGESKSMTVKWALEQREKLLPSDLPSKHFARGR
jgi:hypothetical protein